MPHRRKTRKTRKTRGRRKTGGYRFGQPDEHPAESLYPGTGTQLDSRLAPRSTRRGKRTLKKGGKLRNKL